MRKFLRIAIWFFLFIFFVASIFKTQFYNLFDKNKIKSEYKNELIELAKEALRTNDVPISAIVVYKEQIIGRGYNTVFRNYDAGGHAEINAISDAIKNEGFTNFMNLNRDSLLLISTLEPCPMCKGAIELYRIKHVEFLKEKPILSWLNSSLGDFLYEFQKQQLKPSSIQDSLFKMRPGFINQLSN
ncbi:MAG: nucleoside deaminase [Bacteroidetes bacterium]|nr:nucleoside deaminase [Bacteroidota bacterium]